jgi:O-antigen ligase
MLLSAWDWDRPTPIHWPGHVPAGPKRSKHVKLALAVVALVLVLWGTGTPILSLWLTPVIIFVLWVGIQLGLGYRRRHA